MLEKVFAVEPNIKGEEIIRLLREHQALSEGLTAEEKNLVVKQTLNHLRREGVL